MLHGACASSPAGPERFVIDEVTFISRVAAVADELGAAATRGALRRAEGVQLAADAAPTAGGWRVDAVAQADPLRQDSLQLGLRATPRGAVEAPLVAFVPLAGPGPMALEQAAQQAWALSLAMREVRAGQASDWAGVLASPGWAISLGSGSFATSSADQGEGAASARAQLQAVALDQLVSTRAEGAVNALLERLQRALDAEADAYDRELGLRAVGGLVALADANAVLPLIELAQRRDPALVLQLVYAIGAIGGRHAEGYLVTVASGHPSREVREAARRAVVEL